MLKATREAKSHTTWINPNARYDERWPASSTPSSIPHARRASWTTSPPSRPAWPHFGTFNSLAQTLVKLTAPGVPDIYQGTELWDLSLVDPDNRRPVDWAHRRRALGELQATIAAAADRAALAHELVKTTRGRPREDVPDPRVTGVPRPPAALFETGDYRPLEVRGAWAEHVCAFARVGDGGAALTVIPRLLARRGARHAAARARLLGRHLARAARRPVRAVHERADG